MNSRADSSVTERQTHQSEDGGSIPTSALHVSECPIEVIQPIIERVHYSHSIFGITTTKCFSVSLDSCVVGGAVFGRPAGMGVAKKYSPDGRPLVELRRFVLEDFCPRNSESRVLGVMLRALRKQGVAVVLSYADPAHGHAGLIYRAAGFEYVGVTSKRKHWMWKGKKYPDRNVHQTNFPFHKELRAAIADGSATPVKIPGKHIYVKRFPFQSMPSVV